MSQKVMVLGAAGKMGVAAVAALEKDPRFIVAGCITRQDNLEQALVEYNPDIVVDLTLPGAILANAKAVLAHKKALIIGASGLQEEGLAWIQAHCANHEAQVAIIPNFSVGVALMIKAAKVVAPMMTDCDIVECHHKQKVDAPSATSLHTKKALEEVRGTGAEPVAISSIRNNGFIASQEVHFGQPGERLCISHHTASREAFMPGLLMVCGKIKEKPGLSIGLEAFMA